MISDATGETLITVARAAAAQYTEVRAIEHIHSMVRSLVQLDRIIAALEEKPGIVLYTLVDGALGERLEAACRRIGIPCASVLEPVLQMLQAYLGAPGARRVGAQHLLDADYFRRIEAVEFAVKNDDGAEPRNLPKADLVLVGISRTSKTPLSTYLAQRGLKVANVPLVLGVDPPEELAKVDDKKVFGLIVQPDMLMRIRQARLSHLGMPQDSSYGQRAHIESEIAYSREIFRKHPNWPVLDVTNRAVEETAADILRIYQERNA